MRKTIVVCTLRDEIVKRARLITLINDGEWS